ncbi:putative pal1 cell morphology protein [Lyophyllum shimeji]|uniref:Pal1 cell morphology protein n=1 Tax=Lyophyllum shimeji TaxID=47721 RepID=A0A9P3PHM3_LYOSH|nr:putative pal1 cell morphology protein [Lyophyllum shimeji]
MPAVHQQPPSHSRVRSTSDPFTDPVNSVRRPPPLPPKGKPQHRMPAPISKPPSANRDPHSDITEAVRDTVQVRGSTDYNQRTRVGRSLTSATPSPNHRPTPPRSKSQDSANRHEKSRSSGKTRSKKGSQHADVIDRLDFTGVGPMFHHDGPFDACAPSRNRQRNKAPMYAWTPRPDDVPGTGDSAYPAASAYAAFSDTHYVDPPKKKVDAIAEAWGIHEPEPYEEFFAGGGTGRADGDTPASSIYNGRDSHNSHSTNRSASGQKRAKDGKDARDVYREYLEGGPSADPSRPRVATRRPLVPPPQPIFVPDPAEVENPDNLSPPASSPGHPKRSKSLMHRIRRMREAPNVPVGSDYDQPPSPSSPTDASANFSRPTHRPQNSFLGRFGGSRNANPGADKSEPFVYVEQQNNKDLPAPPQGADETPPDVPVMGYFDGASGGNAGSPPLGRKTSLMQKVGRVVGRGRQ